MDVRDGFNPKKVGFYDAANYTVCEFVIEHRLGQYQLQIRQHDIQCVLYHGPDTAFVDHEICFAFTPRSVT